MKSKNTSVGLSIDSSKYNVPKVSKMAVKATAENIYNKILNSEEDPLVVAEFFKFSKEVEKELNSLSDDNGQNSFTDLVINEIKRNADDGVAHSSKFGTKISIMEAGYKYDYSKCNDPILDSLNKKIKELTEALKSRQDMLKTIKGHMLISFPDPETGELIENHEIYPPSVSSTTTYKTELLKD